MLKNALIILTYGWNFSFKGKFLRVARVKNRRFFPAGPFFFALQMIMYWSTLIPRKLPCPKIFLVTRLICLCEEIETFMWAFNFMVCLRKSTFEIGMEYVGTNSCWYFSLSLNFLWKDSFKSIIYRVTTAPLLWNRLRKNGKVL